MKSLAQPRSVEEVFEALRTEAILGRRLVARNQAMLRLLGWSAALAALAFLIWQTAVGSPVWPPTVSAVLIAMVSLLAGLRLGADSAGAYTADLQRLNKVLAEQNRELEEANRTLLQQVSDKNPSRSNIA